MKFLLIINGIKRKRENISRKKKEKKEKNQYFGSLTPLCILISISANG
jgi:hypothetical protein